MSNIVIEAALLSYPKIIRRKKKRKLRAYFLQDEKARVIQTLLFVAGINTLLQTLFGTRLPAVIGGSYTFVPTTISIILAGRFSDEPDPIEVL